jgi:hypothetical protein
MVCPMTTLDKIDCNGEITGASLRNVGLYPDSGLVVTLDELKAMFGSTG